MGSGAQQQFQWPIWSISVEVLVYAVFFLMLRFVTKSPLLNVIVIVICVNVNAQVCSCLAFFYAGGLAAIGRRAIARSRFRSWLESLAWCAVITVPASIWMFDLQPAIISWVFVLTYMPVLLLCLSGEIALSAPAQRLFVIAGNMTYSSYLLHFPVQLGIAELFALMRRPIPLYDDLFCAAVMMAILLASYLTYRYFEAPAQTLIRGFLLSKGVGRSDGCSPAHGDPWPPHSRWR